MEPENSPPIPTQPTSSSLRWKILRRALRRNSENPSTLNQVSRRARHGFNLIPCRLVDEVTEKISVSLPNRDACFCYTLPLPNAPKLFLRQRLEDCADLNDFEICNRYDIDNTGLVCQWPSEDVLAYYSMTHLSSFRGKRVIELGSGYGLAGLVIAMVTEASEVVISDGNPQVVNSTTKRVPDIKRNIDANSASFGDTKVDSMMLHWDQIEVLETAGTFDVIIASDWTGYVLNFSSKIGWRWSDMATSAEHFKTSRPKVTFFKEFHKGLAQTIRCLLKEDGLSKAILFSPKRGDSLDKFLVQVEGSGLHFSITEIYDSDIWSRHKKILKGNESWPNYETDHCYPLLVTITR